ncbi:Calreticulin family-domain-containing protein [Tribonema minus]|uniref:Calreticulin n=1 Tax=Tribonema minus TaxID=303371 RepID=A0A835ZEE0_9STRA|nr:Calreticulin family-domain-containing protein [Tribonema minus]
MVTRRLVLSAGVALATAQLSAAKVFFREHFNDEGWRERWTVPTKWKSESELGEWGWTVGKWHGGDESNKGIQTSQDSRFYGIIAPLDEPFTQDGDLVVQFSVKLEKALDCGGAYIKLLGGEVDMDSFGGDMPYQVMFGPDICGSGNARTHVIFHYAPKNENLLAKTDVRVERDRLTHVYTLHVKADATYEVYIDQTSVRAGRLEDDFAFLPPRQIPDPNVTKPEDWVDERRIRDPAAVKPDGWDDVPKTIPDADAEKPAEWDDAEDGEWEPAQIPNPDYQGPWRAPMIDNPDYKGEWEQPMIDNPDFKEDPLLYRRCDGCTHVGFELWQVTSGTIFDDIIVTDSLPEAFALAEEGWARWKDKEKAMWEEVSKKEKPEMPSFGDEGDDDLDEDMAAAMDEDWTKEEL